MARIRTSAGALAGLSLLAGGSVLGLRVAADRALGAPEFSIDAGMEQWLLASLGFAAVLLAGHLLLAALRVAREWPYAIVGIAAYAASLAIAAGTALFEVASRSDSISLAVMLPVAAGAIIGVMYPLWAGHDDAGDRPGDLAARLRTSPADFAQFDPASQPVVRTPDETYYSGPVQVRTSFGLLLLAMATPFVVLSALLLLGVHASQEIVLRWIDRAGPRDLFCPSSEHLAQIAA